MLKSPSVFHVYYAAQWKITRDLAPFGHQMGNIFSVSSRSCWVIRKQHLVTWGRYKTSLPLPLHGLGQLGRYKTSSDAIISSDLLHFLFTPGVPSSFYKWKKNVYTKILVLMAIGRGNLWLSKNTDALLPILLLLQIPNSLKWVEFLNKQELRSLSPRAKHLHS